MDWNSITLYVLGFFGLLSLVVTLLTSLIGQVPDLAAVIRAAGRSLKGERDDDSDDSNETRN
ncbi:hypothetical protein [Streptomyces sp. NBC_00658]|uniref:hypothetical protein n=1 Tax=Streptomyces sp. NBC_00658 TaxID=2975800 RepID=UPI00324DBF6E